MKMHLSISKLNIGTRLALAFSAILLLLILTLALALNALHEMQDRTTRIIDNHNVKVSAANIATTPFAMSRYTPATLPCWKMTLLWRRNASS